MSLCFSKAHVYTHVSSYHISSRTLSLSQNRDSIVVLLINPYFRSNVLMDFPVSYHLEMAQFKEIGWETLNAAFSATKHHSGKQQTVTHNKQLTSNSGYYHQVYLSMVEQSLQIGSHVVFHLLQSSPFFPQRTTPKNREIGS